MKGTTQGLTLIESIIAIFLLAAGFVIVSRCFHSALQISATVNTRTAAVEIAQRRIEVVKAWSRLYHFPRGPKTMDEWDSSFTTTYAPDPIDGRFQVAHLITNPDFYLPCTLFEKAVEGAPANPNPLEPAYLPNKQDAVRRQVTVIVNWGGSDSVRLTTMISRPSPVFADVPAKVASNGELQVERLAESQESQLDLPVVGLGAPTPRRACLSFIFGLAGILGEAGLPFALPGGASTITPIAVVDLPVAPVTLSHDGTLNLRAKLRTAGGPIPSPPRFHWSIVGAGTGTLVVDRTGRTATFVHRYENQGIVSYADNRTCQIQAMTIYAGKIVRADSQVITLVP